MSQETGRSSVPCRFDVTAGEYLGQRFSFNKSEITLGRGSENDVILVNDPKISRVHCKVTVTPTDAVIENLSQKNQLFLNGKVVQKEKLINDSVIKVGDTILKFTAEFKPTVISEPYVPPKPQLVVAPISGGVPTQAPSSPTIPPLVPTGGAPGMNLPKVGAGMPVPQGAPIGQGLPIQRPAGVPQNYQPGYQQQMPGMYQANPYGAAQPPRYQGQDSNGRLKLYGGVAVLMVIGYFAFFSGGAKPSDTKKEPVVRTDAFVSRDIATVEKKLRDFESEQAGEQSDRIRRIKENLQRGLRDMQQGNYLRAQESFQVVMNLDSENLLARRYYQVSKVRFDEQVQALMLQAKRSKEKYNYRLCAAHYRSVENLLANKKDSPVLREATNGRKICQVCQERGSDLCRDSK